MRLPSTCRARQLSAVKQTQHKQSPRNLSPRDTYICGGTCALQGLPLHQQCSAEHIDPTTDQGKRTALSAAWDTCHARVVTREGSPDSLAKLDAVLCEQLGGHAAQSSEHGPPGVDDLDLAIPAPADKRVTTMQRCTTQQRLMRSILKTSRAATQDGCMTLR